MSVPFFGDFTDYPDFLLRKSFNANARKIVTCPKTNA